MIVTAVAELTASVVIGTTTDEAPAGTVIEAGTVIAEVFELERVTTVPPGGAAPLRFTAPLAVLLELIGDGAVTVDNAIGLTVKVKDFDTPP